MRYDPLPNTVFSRNRANFSEKMQPNTIAILTSNDVKHTNADDVMGFAQNNDLFYLSGIDQEETVALANQLGICIVSLKDPTEEP